MAYLYDPDLVFLGKLSNRDLDILHNVLVYDRDGKRHITSELHKKPNYNKYVPKHSKYWWELAEEFQYFGGDTVANKIRGYGVRYREILSDVCDFLNINHKNYTSIEEKEALLLFEIMQQALSKSTSEQRREMFDFVNLHLAHSHKIANTLCLKLEDNFRKNTNLINAIGKLLTTVVTPKSEDLLNKIPTNLSESTINNLFNIINTIIQCALIVATPSGPAYRITVPATIQIAYLRRMFHQAQAGKFLPKTVRQVGIYIFSIINKNRNLELPH